MEGQLELLGKILLSCEKRERGTGDVFSSPLSAPPLVFLLCTSVCADVVFAAVAAILQSQGAGCQ